MSLNSEEREEIPQWSSPPIEKPLTTSSGNFQVSTQLCTDASPVTTIEHCYFLLDDTARILKSWEDWMISTEKRLENEGMSYTSPHKKHQEFEIAFQSHYNFIHIHFAEAIKLNAELQSHVKKLSETAFTLSCKIVDYEAVLEKYISHLQIWTNAMLVGTIN